MPLTAVTHVTLMIEDLRGCMDTVVQQVCVPPVLSVDFTTDLTCFGTPVAFTPELLTPAAPADSLIAFNWNFGDPVNGKQQCFHTKNTGTHTFSSVGFYTVSFTTTDKFGCTAQQLQDGAGECVAGGKFQLYHRAMRQHADFQQHQHGYQQYDKHLYLAVWRRKFRYANHSNKHA